MDITENKESICNAEKQLFKEWKELEPYLVTDGVFNENCYRSVGTKILFVLKEPWANEENASFDLREVVGSGEIHPTWTNIARWTKALTWKGDAELNWSDLEETGPEIRKHELQKIVAVNLKKTTGGSSSDMKVVEKWATQPPNEAFLRKQMSIYSPDLIVGCGSHVAHILSLVLLNKEDTDFTKVWKTTSRNIGYYFWKEPRTGKKIPVISFLHPQQRGVKSALLVLSLLDAWSKIKLVTKGN